MQRQKQMEESFLKAHRDFMDNLGESIELLEQDIEETAELEKKCSDEWCRATETNLDELSKLVYSISEPRWLTSEDSKFISGLRRRVHDLYAQYRSMKK